MTPTELMIHDLARAMADLKMADPVQKRDTFVRTLTSLVKFAISQREVEQLNGIRSDLQRVAEIQEASRKAS